jgi:tRNA threonylcarbamoyl adenosine modification protein YeaZ
VLLLALDTATPSVGVAVCSDGAVLAQRCVVDARRHNELLAVGIREVLAAAGLTASQLEGVAVGVGPGPYTGLRVGLVTARSLGHALGIGVHGVCSLDVLAAAAARTEPGEFLVATDARRKEVYWARYRGTASDSSARGERATSAVRLTGPDVARPAEVAWSGPTFGEGGVLYPDSFPDARTPIHPAPGDLAGIVEAAVAAGRPTLDPVPLYLRRPDAVEPGERKKVSGAVPARS